MPDQHPSPEASSIAPQMQCLIALQNLQQGQEPRWHSLRRSVADCHWVGKGKSIPSYGDFWPLWRFAGHDQAHKFSNMFKCWCYKIKILKLIGMLSLYCNHPAANQPVKIGWTECQSFEILLRILPVEAAANDVGREEAMSSTTAENDKKALSNDTHL